MKRSRAAGSGRSGRSGLSVVELMISLALLGTLLAAIGMSSQRAGALVEESTAVTQVQSRVDRCLERVLRELRNAGSARLVPTLEPLPGAPTIWSSSLFFQEAETWTDSAVTWGSGRRLEALLEDGEIANGLDDNGNGLVDEQVLVLTERVGEADEQSIVLAHGISALLEGELVNGLDDNGNGLVDESGLAFDRARGALTVRLSLEGRGPRGRRLVRSRSDSIALRN